MKFSIFLSALLISTAAQAANFNLDCKGGEVCFEKQLAGNSHDFTIAPGSDVTIEVAILHGATITFTSEGAYNQISEVQLAPEPVRKVIVLKNVPVGKSGKFTVKVEPAQISFHGEVSPTSEGYKLKITRVKSEVPGISL